MALDAKPRRHGAVTTHFASPERTSEADLRREAEACLENPVARFLIQALDGLVLILDANRQVLATNDRVLQIADPEDGNVLGRRPGELFGCVHAHEGPAGCGTSHACAHCGAVLAVLEAQKTGHSVESECLLTLRHGALTESAEFAIVASPLEVSGHPFIAVVLHDLSAIKRRDALERLFYHDVANLMQGIRGWADILASGASSSSTAVAQKLANLTDLLDRELRSHRAMAQAEHGDLRPRVRAILPLEILRDVGDLLQRHALAEARKVELLPAPEDVIHTDPELLSRVVLNMAVNAVEASFMGETITLSARAEGQHIRFLVHNPGEIPEEVRSRIFQRSFSTKGAAGRGLGTYAMKLFGENVLKGQVGFDTGPEGTTFWIRLAR
ncbi:HAMP domain-containing sensor histidine kinase [Geothrix sp. PMB-07]|uniref:sensor histidine kinase n=1 Tax=Geothrix sp. PMB-07 TaxID=3068640 RepID=UPI002741B825|nr:HAMP domain-containing sensor histidine kinase [Geothrix sp. PMB-07]WLT31446.1 HAMP domain-containing sensor histidine kinase [Geothrix sp. PMB-07]